jgi:DNA-binding transcriptional regulator YhcF (GntR family)
MGNLVNKLDIKIEPKSARPVYEQIKQGIQVAILSGYLKKGDRLLPIRTLAKNLKVNPNTIVKVYYQLDIEGFIYSKAGLGYFVNCECKNKKARKNELFKNITEEYISKSSKLGFSVEDMFKEIKEFNDKLIGKENRGEDK